MTFLNPLILFGLMAASIPVILHLLNLRKLRKIEFSSLYFLKELQKNKIRKIKIRQILLLIIRTLIVAFLVFSFSRPVMKGYLSGFGSHAKTSVVIILDDSYSMMRDDENGNYFKQAKESAAGIIDIMEEGDDLTIIRTSQLPEVALRNSQNFGAAKKELLNYKSGFKFNTLFTALNSASQILTETKNYNKEIYIITDNQKANYKLSGDDKNPAPLFDEKVRLYLVDIGSKNSINNSVENVEVLNKIFEKDNPVNLKVTLKNYGNDTKDALMSVYLSGKRVSQKNVNMVNGSIVTEISFVPHNGGYLGGYVELEDDELPLDNRRYFSLFIPEQLNILLSGDDESDYMFPKIALSSFGTDSLNKTTGEIFKLTAKRNSAFVSTNLSSFDAIMLFGAGNLSSGDFERIKSFLLGGGGVIFFPSNKGDISTINNFFNSIGVSGVSGFSDLNSSFLSFSKIDYDHPLFQGIFENKFGMVNRQIESPQILKSVNLNINRNSVSVISLSNSYPFLMDCDFGNSKVLVYSVNPSLEWSDYPFKGLFIPLTYKSIFYVANRFESGSALLVGEKADIGIKTSNNDPITKLIYPDGEEEKISLNQTPSGYYYNFSNTNSPGIYSFSNSNKIVKTIPVNLSADESDMEKISTSGLDEFMNSVSPLSQYKYLDKASDITSFLQEARYGVELWKELLIITLILILMEMFIARDSKKELTEALINK